MQALKSLFFLIFLLSSNLILAQQDTIYFDEYWEIVDDFNEMVYYRISTNNRVDGKYFIQDYYANENLQMEGYSLTEDASVLDGKITWYNSNGSLEKVSNYLNGKREGEEINYFSSGTIQSIGINKNDSPWSGMFPMYDQSMEVVEYDNGAPIAIYSFYQDQKTYTEKLIVDSYDPNFNHHIFYDTNGNQIAEAEYSNYDSQYEFPIKGTKIYYQYDEDNFAIKPIGKADFKEVSDGIEMTTTLEGYPNKFTGTIGYNFSGQIYFFRSGNLITYQDGERNGITISRINSPEKNLEGIYKDDFPYSGDFYESDPTIINHYENGELNGLQQIFDENNQLVEQANYKDGQYDGDRLTTNDFTGEQYHATYKQGVPLEGQVFRYSQLVTYKNGFQVEDRKYDDNTGQIESITVTKPDDSYETLYKEFFRNGKVYRLDFKKGWPYNGVEYTNIDSFETYTKGEVTGPYQNKVEDLIEKGHYVYSKKHGKITYNIGSEEYSCVFEDGRPISGVTYEPYFKTKITYENGKKNGPFSKKEYSYYYDYDSLTMNYKNNLPVGKVQYFSNQSLVAEGEFKNGLPFDGTFYSNDTAQVFLKGELNKITIFSRYSGYIIEQFHENGILTREVASSIDNPKKIHTLIFKNGKPWEGIQLKVNESDYRLVTIKNGKQNGSDTSYFYGDVLESSYNYLDGKKDGKQYYYRQDSLLFESKFKNGIPIEGDVVSLETKNIIQVESYENRILLNSRIIKIEHTEPDYSLIAECSYKNGKPYDGSHLLSRDGEYIVQKYEQGRLVLTYIGVSVNFYTPDGDFSYEAKIKHESTKDVVDYGVDPAVIINYTNQERTSGVATYYEGEKKKIGSVSFNQLTINEMDLESSSYLLTRKYIYKKNKDNTLQGEVLFIRNNFEISIRLEIDKQLKNPAYASLYHPDVLIEPKGDTFKLDYIYKKKNKLIGSIKIVNDKPYSGIVINQSYDSMPDEFNFAHYEEGKLIETETMRIEEYLEKYN